ncbi:hypothetical protein J2T57_001702 [Natronocella acetinitrilica]|uniref:Uncharacterized protein n=1 Tax=Natronocella acetinitrilica TaxID=414046 RepID=A0AAE3KAP4_9GAMM|nr:hypothetical protein [Natronocella acetinitrilica]MCP1674600.1 hypothetical protein [Natronocella acetinitrilica]
MSHHCLALEARLHFPTVFRMRRTERRRLDALPKRFVIDTPERLRADLDDCHPEQRYRVRLRCERAEQELIVSDALRAALEMVSERNAAYFLARGIAFARQQAALHPDETVFRRMLLTLNRATHCVDGLRRFRARVDHKRRAAERANEGPAGPEGPAPGR